MNAESVLINGGNPLRGQVSIQGAKNAALPILASTILIPNEVYLHNVPDLLDIRAMLEILEFLGATYTFESGTIYLNNKNIQSKKVPVEISDKLRASSLVMGSMLGRFGEAEVGMPGGCQIGARPLNFHFSGFEAIGATVELTEEDVIIDMKGKSISGQHTLEFPSVGATENLITASVYAKGTVTLRNIAIEPEIKDLINFLNKAGAKIRFTDISEIEITGVDELKAVEYHVKADRIEAGTFLMAAYATKGEIKLIGADADDLGFVIKTLREMGASIESEQDTITLKYNGMMKPTNIRTSIYPGFPTDLQPQMSVLLSQAEGTSVVVENIFENRLRHFEEMQKMNGKIKIEGNQAYIEQSELTGATVDSFDLRGAAAMIVAGLCANGTTRVTGMKYLHRGYDSFVEKLRVLGADISYF